VFWCIDDNKNKSEYTGKHNAIWYNLLWKANNSHSFIYDKNQSHQSVVNFGGPVRGLGTEISGHEQVCSSQVKSM